MAGPEACSTSQKITIFSTSSLASIYALHFRQFGYLLKFLCLQLPQVLNFEILSFSTSLLYNQAWQAAPLLFHFFFLTS